MNEAEWLACTDPLLMLRFVWGKVTERKERLFSAACCRRIWQLLPDERSRRAVGLPSGMRIHELPRKGSK